MDNKRALSALSEMLEEQAARRHPTEATITYKQLAERLGLPQFRGPDWMNHPLSKLLGTLNEEDHTAGRPFRSVLVVNAESGRSGNSFFVAAAELRGEEIPKERQMQYWDAEFLRLLKHYNNPHV